MNDPPIRALFVAANNPAVTCPDAGKVRQGLMREDLFTVVHDPFMTDDRALRRYRAAGDDLSRNRGFLPRLRHLLPAIRAAPPCRRRARHGRICAWRRNWRERMGLDRSGVPHERRAELTETLFRGAKGRAAALDPESVARCRTDLARADRRPGIPHPVGKARILFGAAGRRRACADARLAARSAGAGGCRALAAAPADRARLFPGPHRLCRRRLPAPARRQAVLHPAPRRGRPRAASRTAPRCGSSTTAARSGWCSQISDEIQPGVVLVPGQRPDSETVAGTINMLVDDRYTDIGEGATYQSTFLDVEAWPET